MSPLIDGQLVRSRMPWADSPASEARIGGMNGMRHRGWLLVDVRDWRYAVNDETGERIRVCKDRASASDAMHMFRDVVDEHELADEIIRLRKSGVGSPEIASRLKTSRAVVNKVMRKHAKEQSNG